MAKNPLPEMIIKYKGVFDFNNLFRVIYEWLIRQGFEVHEGKYKHKIPNPKGAEQEIGWDADRKINHYIKFHVKVDYKIWDLKEVEVVKEKEKKKMSFAKIRIVLSGAFETDYNNQWNTKFLNKLDLFFRKFIIRQDLDVLYGDQLYYRLYKLHKVIKEALDMEAKTNAFEGRW